MRLSEYFPFMLRTLFVITCSFLCLSSTVDAGTFAHSREEIEGPVRAVLLRVVDGDTILVAARPWPQQSIEVYVRLRGIDAPELKSGCQAIRAAGERAHLALAQILSSEPEVTLNHISGDKYFGRVLADVSLKDGRNPAQQLLGAGYVSAYQDRKMTAKSCAFWE